MPKSNEAIAKMFIKLAWNREHYHLLHEYVTHDFQYHTTFDEKVFNFEEYVAFVKSLHEAMPDIDLTIEDVMVKGDKAIVHSIISGSICKPLFGFPVTDKLLTFEAMSTMMMINGKIQSLDTLIDMGGIQRQLQRSTSNTTKNK